MYEVQKHIQSIELEIRAVVTSGWGILDRPVAWNSFWGKKKKILCINWDADHTGIFLSKLIELCL